MFNASETALILIGYQNDYFSEGGVLHKVIEQSSTEVLANSLKLVEALEKTEATIIDLPISFTPDYSELNENAEGILAIIREKGAFQVNQPGSEVVPELEQHRNNLTQITGKRGLNGFRNTELDDILRGKGIKNILLAGAVTSVCIDSTGRAATEKGYRVTIVSSCTSARSQVEQDFYCSSIFPIYATVTDHTSIINDLAKGVA